MVQLMIPECFLDPIWDPDADTSRDTMMHKIEWDLLPKGDKPILVKEPDNGPTRLLCAVLWIKLSRLFLNKGTQKEATTIFCMTEKQLSRLMTGHKYWGGTNCTAKKRLGEKKNSKEKLKERRVRSLKQSQNHLMMMRTTTEPDKG